MNTATLTNRPIADLIDEYYQLWLKNPESVDPTWRAFFQGFALGNNGQALTGNGAGHVSEGGPSIIDSLKQSQVHALINAYRTLGHTQAHLDPLSPPPEPQPKLLLSEFGLSEADLDETFDIGTYLGGGQKKLRDIVDSLRATYCGHIGVEYIHIQDTDVRHWLEARMEPSQNKPTFTKQQKVRILRRLHKADLFEKFLHTKYIGQKRFSLEGGETMITALDAVIENSPNSGVEEIVLCMAHPRRLSVLPNILLQPFRLLFQP